MVLGIALSLVLIGPVFFMLIETSLIKGSRAAIIMDLGVLSADIFCIVLAYYGSREIAAYIQTHPVLFKMGAIVIFIYGCFMIYSRGNFRFKDEFFSSKSAWRLFAKGFLLNFANVGILVFWIYVVLFISVNYDHNYQFFIYIFIVLGTFFAVDLLKIFLASKLHNKFSNQLVYKIRRICGVLLIAFGLFLFIKSFFSVPFVNKSLLQNMFDHHP